MVGPGGEVPRTRPYTPPMAPGSPSPSAGTAPDLSRLRIQRDSAPVRRGGGSPLVWILLLGALGFVGWAYASGRLILDQPGGVPRVATGLVIPPGSAVAKQGEVTGNGYVIARKRAALSTVLSGRLVELNVEEGSTVKENEVVARIQHDDLDAAVAAAKQDVAVASARKVELQRAHAAAVADLDRLKKDNAVLRDLERQARVESERTDADVARNRALFEQRIIDEARWRVYDAAAKAAAAALAAASSRVAAGEAAERSWEGEIARRAAALETADAEIARVGEALRQAEIHLDKTFIRAPFAGLVVHKDAELGEVVAATGAGGNSRGSVATIVDPKTLEVQVELSETRLGTITQGDATRIVLDAAPERSFRGRVRQVWPTADRQKATVEMRIEFVEWPEIVKPEMGARVTFLAKGTPDAPEAKRLPKVPARAVVRKGDQAAVFVLAGGRVRRTDVRLGTEAGGLFDVENGLAGGEQVVLDPPVDLADGAAVTTNAEKK